MFSRQVFYFPTKKEGWGGARAEVARRRQIEWSHGSCLGSADRTAARQAEWAVECLSSCRVHSTQWKATHLVRGPLGQGVSTLTLLNHHKWVTKSEVVRNLYLIPEKCHQTMMFGDISAVWSCLVKLLFKFVIAELFGLFYEMAW